MTKQIDTVVEDIYEMIDSGVEDFNPISLLALSEDIMYSVDRQLVKGRREDRNTLRMSNIGYPDRKLWYEVREEYEKEELLPQTRLKFLFGDIVEALLLFLVRESGHTVESEQAEVELEGIKGHIDAVIDGVLVDVKSAASRSFEKFENNTLAEDDPFGYIGQISGYSQAMGLKRSGFLAFDKQMGKIAWCEAEEMDRIDAAERIRHLKEVTTNDTPPERCYEPVPDGKSGNMKLPVGCAYCPYKVDCWKDTNDGQGLRLFLYSNGPRWLTNVERKPDVYEDTSLGRA